MSKTQNLNGWQRLWVFIVLIYMIPLSLILYNTLPNQKQVEHEQVYEIFECITENDPNLQKYKPYKLKEIYKDIPDNLIIKNLNQKFFGTPSGDCIFKLNKKYSNNYLFNKQFDYAKEIFLVWLLPSVSLYLLGIMIGWIRRGFANK